MQRMIAVLFCVFALGAAKPSNQPPLPLTEDPESQQPAVALASWYSDLGRETDEIATVIQQLQSADSVQRQSAGNYLLALFKQSLADEQKGVAFAVVASSGGISTSPARVFRRRMAQELAKARIGEEGLDALLWLVDNDPEPENQAAGAIGLARISSPRMHDIFQRLLSLPGYNRVVTVTAIEQAGQRRMTDLASLVAPYCADCREPVRQAAIKQASMLGISPPNFDPAYISPWVENDLTQIASMVLTPILQRASWHRFTNVQTTEDFGGHKEFSGWLLDETAESYRVLDWFGRDISLSKKDTRLSQRTMREDVAEFLKLRADAGDFDSGTGFYGFGGGRNEVEKLDRTLSIMGELTGQFEPAFSRLPEMLVAAWSIQHGDRATAAAVIFPCYARAIDMRQVRQAARDEIGGIYHQQMLDAFSSDRDYAKAIAIAQHLSKPQFDGYMYQSRAKELVEQLSRRQSEDFKTLTLPTPQQWSEQRKTMTRAQQIVFLADRLRLLNCFQMSQPGGVSYEDQQYDRPWAERIRLDDPKKIGLDDPTVPAEVINPFSELLDLKLEVSELPPLLPYLADDDYMLIYDYWRNFAPYRLLHRVNMAVINIVNETACCDLVDFDQEYSSDNSSVQKQIPRIVKWVAENSQKTHTQLLLEALPAADNWYSFEHYAMELVDGHSAEALPIVLRRANDFGQYRSGILKLLYKLGPDKGVDLAHKWIDDDDRQTRFWACMILLHSGDRATLEGLGHLRWLIENDYDNLEYTAAADELVSTGRHDGIELACELLPHYGDSFDFEMGMRWPVVQHLVLARQIQAMNCLITALNDNSQEFEESGIYQGHPIKRKFTVGDSTAINIAHWRNDGYEYPRAAPDAVREKARHDLAKWLMDQFKLIQQAKPSGLPADHLTPLFDAY